MSDLKEKEYQSADHISDIKDIVAELSNFIDKHPTLKQKNFGLFYQNGRIGYLDLDVFAEKTKAKLDPDSEEKSLTELQKDIDKNEE